MTLNDAGFTNFSGSLNGSLALVLNGPGVQVLSGALGSYNGTYNGNTTTVNGGTLQLGAVNPVSATGFAVFNSGVVDLKGFGLAVNEVGGNGTVTNTAAAATLTFNNGSPHTTTANLTGNLGLNVTSSANTTQTLTGINTFTGNTTLISGTLQLSSATALPSTTALVFGTSACGTALSLGGFDLTVGSLQGGNAATGNINLGANNLTVGTNNLTTSAYAGNISGSGNLTKVGTGSLTLSGPSTYTGNTTIISGSVQVTVANALPTATTLFVNSPGTFDLNGCATTLSGLAGNGTVTDSGAPITLTLNSTGSQAFNGLVSGSLGLAETGSGTLTLSGNNSYTGPTSVSGGVLSVSSDANLGTAPGAVTPASLLLNGGTLQATASFTLNSNRGIALGPNSGSGTGIFDVTANQTLSYAGVLANNGNGTGSLVKTDTGTLTLSGANTYAGSTTVSGGTLQVGAASAVPTTTTLTVNTGTFALNGFSQTLAGLAGNGTVTDNGVPGTLTFTGSGNQTFNGNITGTNLALTQAGNGTQGLSGANTYSGITTITSGALSISSDANLGTAPGSATPGSLVINGGTLQANGTFTLNSNRGIALGPASGTGTGTIDVTANNILSYGGVLADNNNGSGSLVQTDAGTLVLSGTNTYSGITTINGGTLQVGGANAMPTTAAVTVTSPGTFDLAGFNQDLARVAGNGTVTDSGAAATLTLNTTGSRSFEGIFAGSLALTQAGSGTLTLDGTASNYTGCTTVSAGTLKDGVANALPSATTLIVTTPGTFDLGGFNQTLAGIAGNGTATDTGLLATLTFNTTGTQSFGGLLSGSWP